MPEQDDSYLIAQILSGETHVFSALLDRYHTKVFNYAFYILRDREEAEEATQDTFVNAYRSLNKFRNESRFSTWLLRIAYHNSLTRLRKVEGPMVGMEENGNYLEISGGNNITRQTDLGDMKELLTTAMNKLNEEEKALVTLFYYSEQSIKEICEITGKTLSNVKVILHRSRQKMLKSLNSMGVIEWTS